MKRTLLFLYAMVVCAAPDDAISSRDLIWSSVTMAFVRQRDGRRCGDVGMSGFHRHEARVVERGCAGLADLGGHGVEREALFARDAAAVVVGPGREQEQPSLRAGVEVEPRRLELRREAVFAEGDERKLRVQRGAGDRLFAGADAGRDQDGPALGGVEQPLGFGGERVGRDAPRALDLQAVGAIEKKGVSVGGVVAPREREAVDAREVVGVLANEREAARVVRDVAQENFQLASVGQDPVVVAGGEQARCVGHIWPTTERQITEQPRPIRLGAADLEAANDLAEVAAHAPLDEEQPMEMVGHDDAGEQLNLRVVARYLAPAGLDALAERRLLDGAADEATQNGTPPLDFERDHVDAALVVVVAEAPLLHLGGQGIGFACHGDIIPKERTTLKAA